MRKVLLWLLLAVVSVQLAAAMDIFEAAFVGNTSRVKSLLQKNPDLVNARDAEGVTALMNAAGEGHRATVRTLLNAGADPNLAKKNGETALMYAAYKNHAAVVEILLRAGANPDAMDNDGFTALMAAAQLGHMETVKSLVIGGARIDLKDKKGRTAVDHAWNKDQSAIAKFLKDYAIPGNSSRKRGKNKDTGDPDENDVW